VKYLKTFESIFNFDIGIFTIKEAQKLYQKYLEKYDYEYDLKDKIHYYDDDDFDIFYTSDNYIKTCRFIIAFNENDILGICKIAFFESSNHYAVNYLSTNKDFLSMGISKKLLEELFKYFSKKHSNEILNFSGYSVEGWKYLRKYILEYSKKYNVKIIERGVEYPGLTGETDEYWKLCNQSKEEIKKL
jgi:GNAT superfamily N-acetyltransferase